MPIESLLISLKMSVELFNNIRASIIKDKDTVKSNVDIFLVIPKA